MPTFKPVCAFFSCALLLAPPLFAERKKLGDLPSDSKKIMPKEELVIAAPGEPEPPTEPLLEDNVAEEFYQKGLKALNDGELEQAETFFDRVLVIKPNHKGAQEGIAYIMQTLEDPQPPKVAPAPNPKLVLLEKLNKQLDAEISKGNWEEAHTVSSKMLAVDPDHTSAKPKFIRVKRKLHDAAIERAREREAKEDYTGAIDAYRTAQTYWNDPVIPENVIRLRKKMAQEKLKKSETLYVEALQKSQEGKIEEAVQLCKQSLTMNPDNMQAQRMLDRLQPRPAK